MWLVHLARRLEVASKRVWFRKWSPTYVSTWHVRHVKGLWKVTGHATLSSSQRAQGFGTSDSMELYPPVGGANCLLFQWRCNLKLWCIHSHSKNNMSTCFLSCSHSPRFLREARSVTLGFIPQVPWGWPSSQERWEVRGNIRGGATHTGRQTCYKWWKQ